MNVIIVGCGRVGSRLAVHLTTLGHQVSIIDSNREAFLRLSPDFAGRTIHGSALDVDVLTRAGAETAEVVVGLTGGDNRNLLAVQIAKHRFKVPRVIARLHDPVRSAKYRELGVETLCTTTVLAGLLELHVDQGGFPELPPQVAVAGDAGALEDPH